jgi:hypothetical protein
MAPIQKPNIQHRLLTVIFFLIIDTPIERVDKLRAEKRFNVVVLGTSDVIDSNHKTLVSVFSLLVPLKVQSLC